MKPKTNPKRIRQTKRQSKTVERVLVNDLLSEIDLLNYPITHIVDTDSKVRVFHSGHDFQLIGYGKVLFVEAKRTLLKSENLPVALSHTKMFAKLSSTQQMRCFQIVSSYTQYYILHFKVFKGAVFSDLYLCNLHERSKDESYLDSKLVLTRESLHGVAMYFRDSFYITNP